MSFNPSQSKFVKSFISVIILSVYACGSHSTTVTIEGKIDGSRNKFVIVRDASHNQLATIDSTKTDGVGAFELSFDVSTPQFVLLQVEGELEPIVLLVEPNEKVVINGIYGSVARNYTIRGSKGSQLVRELNGRLNGTVSKIDSLSTLFRSSRENVKFDSIKLAIDTVYNDLIESHKSFTVDFIKKNRYSLASILALYQQYDKTTPVLNNRDDFELFRLVDSVLYPLYPDNQLVSNLHSNVKKISAQLKLYDKRENMLKEGDKLPNISLPLLNGAPIMLYDIRSRYILVDLWATWCNECIPNNMKLREIYTKYSPKGFEVVQISLDENPRNLSNALENDSIPWIVASDFMQFNSPIVDTLSINSIPSNYLINRQGIIQARNLSLKELEDVLSSLLP